MRKQIYELLGAVTNHYVEQGKISRVETHERHDIHTFLSIAGNEDQGVHIQAYPGMSSPDEARVWARLMSSERMMALRRSGTPQGFDISPGNEHDAVIKNFPNFEIGVMIPYDHSVLEKMLEENVPELK